MDQERFFGRQLWIPFYSRFWSYYLVHLPPPPNVQCVLIHRCHHVWSGVWSHFLESILEWVFIKKKFKNAFCFIYKNSHYNLLPVEGIIWRIDYIKIYGWIKNYEGINSKSYICKKLSDTLTQKRCRRHGRCGIGVRARVCFFCPSDFLSPYFSEYTNDEPLKINVRFIDPPNHILVQFLHRDLFFSCLLNLGFETIILLALNF